MRHSFLGMLACVAACQSPSAPSEPYRPPPARCVSNPALLASDPACVPTPEPTPVGFAVRTSTSSGTLAAADSTFAWRISTFPALDEAHQWFVGLAVFVRLSNGDTRPSTNYTWTPEDSTALVFRYGPDAVRAFRSGCYWVRLSGEGVTARMRVLVDVTDARTCP